MSKCVKCKNEYNHYKDTCPKCRKVDVLEDILAHIEDIELKDPWMEDEKEGNHELEDNAQRGRVKMLLGHPEHHITKGTRRSY